MTYVLKVSKHENSDDSMWRYYMYTRMRKCGLCAKSFPTRNEFWQHGEQRHVEWIVWFPASFIIENVYKI